MEIKRLHPVSNFIWIAVMAGVLMVSMSPFYVSIALITAMLTLLYQKGCSFWRMLLKCLPLFLFPVLLNPLFSHEGMTILLYFKNGNPLTLESIYYGLGMGEMLLSVLLWYAILNDSMSSDKWVQLFGRFAPFFGLLFSMVLRMIPTYQKAEKKIRECNPKQKAGKRFLMLLTYALETSVDTADSMAARGYGSHRRHNFKIYRWRFRDSVIVLLSVLVLGVIILASYREMLTFYYYPIVYQEQNILWAAVCYGGYALLGLLPLGIEIKEKIRWNYLESKI